MTDFTLTIGGFAYPGISMSDPPASGAKKERYSPKVGDRIIHEHGGGGVVTRRNPRLGAVNDAWMVRYDDTGAELPALAEFLRLAPPDHADAGGKLCDACGAEAAYGPFPHSPEPVRSARLCHMHACATAENICRELILARRKSLQSPTADGVESWHGFAKGERVTHKDWGCEGVVTGGGPNFLLCARDDGKQDSTNMFPREAIRVEPKPAPEPVPQPRRDPYAEHNAALSKKLGLSIERDPKVIDEHVAYQTACLSYPRVPTRTERHRAQHLAELDRPIRTGALGDRDRYGQRLSLKGWPEDSEYKDQV